MEKNNLESIWADGIPAHIEAKDRLEPEALLGLSVRFVLEHIIHDKGYTILGGHANLNQYPNLLLAKEDEKYAVAVVPCLYPHFIPKNNQLRIDFAKASIDKGFIPILCPVPVKSVDPKRAQASIYLKGDLFQFANIGQIHLTSELEQEITPQTLSEIL